MPTFIPRLSRDSEAPPQIAKDRGGSASIIPAKRRQRRGCLQYKLSSS